VGRPQTAILDEFVDKDDGDGYGHGYGYGYGYGYEGI
jgi:hypothetical protein